MEKPSKILVLSDLHINSTVALYPETKAFSRFGLLLSSGGRRFDIAHHTSMGNLPWTAPNAANVLAAKVMFDYANRGEEPPDFVIRGHVHRWGDSYDAYRTRANWQIVSG